MWRRITKPISTSAMVRRERTRNLFFGDRKNFMNVVCATQQEYISSFVFGKAKSDKIAQMKLFRAALVLVLFTVVVVGFEVSSKAASLFKHNYYIKDLSGNVYYRGPHSGWEYLLGNFDLLTLAVIDKNFVKDKDSVYFTPFEGDHKLIDADASTFKKIKENHYLDRNNLYEIYPIHNPRTATVGLAHIPIDDSASFEFIDANYAKDKFSIYYLGQGHRTKLVDGNPSDFKIYNADYISSGNNVYFQGRLIAGAVADDFQLLSLGFAKSSQKIFLLTTEVSQLNGMEFEVDPKGDAYSKDGVLLLDRSEFMKANCKVGLNIVC